MNTLWYFIGVFTIPLMFAFAIFLWLFYWWYATKKRIWRARKEWHYENPYWEEAFSSGLQHVLPDLKNALTSANPYGAIGAVIEHVENLIKYYKAEGRKEAKDGKD